ncbi:MAG TPA: glycoside hydrolase [Candidatus Krumholzibacteria bacterium]|nr:glycoside hydrolase [Candidatus Krumholzibacteria bacterium]HPD73100.1 glycoside hydrolase [Candidatus Krumholzibacteria bacterium]HRY41900.1 glycoside hydrolase [Candidatus Krumholzibacteria bacterium]
MPPTLLLIHHSHTDLGYTDPQGVVDRWHGAYLRQALAAIAADPTFRWQGETFHAVERFLADAGEAERARFLDAVAAGRIGLSASWLNLNELADQPLLAALTGRAAAFARETGLPIRSAMTADINGYSWGFGTALLDAGVENLFTCIHTHHGMYPLGHQQVGFWWEAPDERRLLVWSGEHYHFGNELGLAPGAVSSYLTKDDCDADLIFHDPWTVAERRIPRYLARLREVGYAHDVIPVAISGLRSDNAPPSPAIAAAAARWSRVHGNLCRVELATLDAFFGRVRAAGAAGLPVYRGDWPDWWSDGLASEPVATRLFRQAQRDWIWLRALRARHPELPAGDLVDLETQLGLYAEHTFSHSDSVTAPWHELVQRIAARKRAHAAVALDTAAARLDAAFTALGGGAPTPDRPLRFRVVNPLAVPVAAVAPLVVEHFEYRERHLDGPVRVRDAAASTLHPWQRRPVPRGMAFDTPLALAPGEERELELLPVAGRPQPDPEPLPWTDTGALVVDSLSVSWRRGPGITAIATGDRALLHPEAPHAAFAPIFERTPAGGPDDQARVRGAMGLDRKGPDEIREAARCTGGRVLGAGPVSVRQLLRYEGAGLSWCEVELAVERAAPALEASVRLHHPGTWDPVNVYLPLPLVWPGARDLWAFKAGAAIRPWRDQLPGTLTDWTCLQEGFAWCGPDGGLAVACLDSPLLWLGPLRSGPRLLMGDPRLPARPEHLYAWVATTFWETNFAADVGGFHEFRFRLSWGPDLASPATARDRCLALQHGLRAFRLGA